MGYMGAGRKWEIGKQIKWEMGNLYPKWEQGIVENMPEHLFESRKIGRERGYNPGPQNLGSRFSIFSPIFSRLFITIQPIIQPNFRLLARFQPNIFIGKTREFREFLGILEGIPWISHLGFREFHQNVKQTIFINTVF